MLSFFKSSNNNPPPQNEKEEVEEAADAYIDEQTQEWKDQVYDIIRYESSRVPGHKRLSSHLDSCASACTT